MGLGERTDAHGPALPNIARWARRKQPVAALALLAASGVILPSNFDPQDLATDLRLLAS